MLHGLLCLVCEIHSKILYGLLGLLCERCDSFSQFIFDKVFINWGTCFVITRLSRQLPICLVCMPMHIWYICFQVVFLYKLFFLYFNAPVFWLHCCEVFFNAFWCIWFQVAIAYRFLMASIYGEGIGFTHFLYYYIQNVLVKNFLIARRGLFFPYLWICVFCSSY